MIKVLEHGQKKVTCPNCKAKLTYEQEDIQTKRSSADFMFDEDSEIKYIVCPDCGNKIILTPVKR
jgi:DNA-directed RNA polymerase subunit RPC12/RpoP